MFGCAATKVAIFGISHRVASVGRTPSTRSAGPLRRNLLHRNLELIEDAAHLMATARQYRSVPHCAEHRKETDGEMSSSALT